MCKLSANVAFDNSTNGQADIKQEMWEILSFLSLKALSAIGTLISSSTRTELHVTFADRRWPKATHPRDRSSLEMMKGEEAEVYTGFNLEPPPAPLAHLFSE